MIQHKLRMQPILVCTLLVITGLFNSAMGKEINKINWQTDYRKAYKESRITGKPMLLKFTAPWCVFCHKMKKSFANDAVAEQVNENYIAVIINADNEKELSEALEVEGLPTTVVLTNDLEIAGKIKGFLSPAKLSQSLNKIMMEINDEASIKQISLKNIPEKNIQQSEDNQLEFGGICLVSLMDQKKVIQGEKEFFLKYHDYHLAFTSEDNKEAFLKNPQKYWPALNGYCPVSAAGDIEAKGDAKLGVFYKGKLWFFANKDNRHRFATNPRIYLKALDQKDLLE